MLFAGVVHRREHRGHRDDATNDPLFEVQRVEVDEQTDLNAGEAQVGEELGLVNPGDRVDRLHR